MNENRNIQLLEDAQKKFRRLEAPAMRAREYLKSPEYQDESAAILARIDGIVGTGEMTDSQALIAIGRIQQLIEGWKQPNQTIVEFESAKGTLNNILGSVAR